MDMKSSIKQRREERIRDLLTRDDLSKTMPIQPPSQPSPLPVRDEPRLWSRGKLPESYVPEPDPEKQWKKERYQAGGPFHRKHHFVSGFMWRVFFSAIVFAGVWGVFHFPINQPWSGKVQSFVVQSLNREMDFQAAEAWYETYFGKAPSFIPIFKQDPVSPLKVDASKSMVPPIDGKIVQAFAVNLKGVEIAPDEVSSTALQVKSVETGRVMEVSDSPETGVSVTIQHSGGLVATYSHLQETQLQKNDWVEAGDPVGSLGQGSDGETPTLFFAVKEGGHYVDPADVIPID
ncbi:hypothetical protein BCV73_20340 [Paenibacillus sp. SSG-1]|nr:hypothetical protein BCV73_20340 [Paenibacillus sp. SSG-1]